MVQSLAIAIPSITIPAAATAGSTIDSPSSEASESTIAFAEIPLTALSKNTRRQLSSLLNARKILRSEEGYERDWRGIAALAQQKNLCDENAFSCDDAMTKVLQLWCSNNPQTATFANLEHFLGIIDRWDVSDDIYENLAEDAKNYNAKLQQTSLTLALSDDELDLVAQSPNNNIIKPIDDFGIGSDSNILTKDDVLRAQKGLPPQKYDAFVLFADADINYAVEMITKLEDNAEYNFKLCLKDRDLLAGVSFAHVALTQLIEERCKHLIVILTEEFIKSPENKFLVNYTQALQIQHKTRKIIPLIYEDSVAIPRTLKIYTHLKYNNKNTGGLFNFWTRLASSIRNVSLATTPTTPEPASPASPTSPVHYIQNNCSVSVSSAKPRPPLSSLSTLLAPSAMVATQIAAPNTINLNHLPTPPTEIPSININGHAFTPEDEEDIPKKKERNKFKKRSSLRHNTINTNGKLLFSGGLSLRNAHSTSQLNANDYQENCNSMSDLSTSSGYSEPKKKKKWPSKLFKKVFSRSSTKLQETA